MDLTPYLFDTELHPQRYRRDLVGAICFDRSNQLLYLFERQADEEKSIIHVWRVEEKIIPSIVPSTLLYLLGSD